VEVERAATVGEQEADLGDAARAHGVGGRQTSREPVELGRGRDDRLPSRRDLDDARAMLPASVADEAADPAGERRPHRRADERLPSPRQRGGRVGRGSASQLALERSRPPSGSESFAQPRGSRDDAAAALPVGEEQSVAMRP
jgi:hypothetical protein